MCATVEVLELVRTVSAGGAAPACHFDRANLAVMFYCPACRAGFTWVIPRAAGACGAP